MTDDLTVLRMVAIKGRVSADALAESLGYDVESVQGAVDAMVSGELLKDAPMGYRVTKEGRERCADLVAAERAASDEAVVSNLYETFCAHNHDLKQIVTDWQIRGAAEPNDHSDRDYDARVLGRLTALHATISPLLGQIVDVAPRFAHYRARLNRAAAAVAAGDLAYVTKPILDSYHTVWFELHEDLIGLSGLTRAEEADAGRGE